MPIPQFIEQPKPPDKKPQILIPFDQIKARISHEKAPEPPRRTKPQEASKESQGPDKTSQEAVEGEIMPSPQLSGHNQVKRDERGRIMPGASLNPAGKPAGLKNAATRILDMLESVEVLTTKGEKVKMYEAILTALISQAAKGNLRAIEMIIDRIDGKPRQALEITPGQRPGTAYLDPKDEERIERLFGIKRISNDRKDNGGADSGTPGNEHRGAYESV